MKGTVMKTKAFLAVLLIAVGFCVTVFLSYKTQGATLEGALENSVPVGKGKCAVDVPKFGELVLECIKGLRADGANLFAILFGGEIVAVYERVGEVTRLIWAKEWQDT